MSFDQILHLIQSQNPLIIYLALFVAAFIENIFPPFPGDTTTLVGAFIAGSGNIGYIGVLISVTMGGVLGAMFLYFIGREKGRTCFEHRKSKYFGGHNLLKVERLFGKYGSAIILFSRFFAGIRSVVAIAAGVGDVRPTRMALLTFFSNLLWSALLVYLMYYSKSNWQLILDIIKKYHTGLVAVLLIILIAWILVNKWHKRKN